MRTRTEKFEIFSIEIPEHFERSQFELGGYVIPASTEWYWTQPPEPVMGGPFMTREEAEMDAKRTLTIQIGI